ncbi:MAG: hypothetical protein Pg6B_08600 [Candidatus Azobacteroides pseudotrichonymphae]|jgi:preprotein translocase subunit SecG|uniref:Protein-export membrane protein SecG n=1 Tax=Azobacteroides pseudotrichonymphae genomovar. CFP2 TaxID=511995 RepID=B6YQ54_AZOPC|nr:preprotein translocase subunit SecG [Candidatus Azobacteroides pseudotrichonymphae]MDR0530118.1 preprotein translocase subunit SecG [Bacteroidales bacterium OttesenSCG-928-I14]BAG83326.1 putative preprotein translocase SecG subunit [Candidatus Azobacteroides pseudotrichonymphae genomovar. CFP2]GMO37065.1 MAG: hypothetical protein Pg6B_08600 [Candidatus Azobacteroides pseudotrichonymphae]
MCTFVVVLVVIVAILLIFVVVVQNSKGGGLASGFTSANQVMGVRKTTDLFEKITWWLAGSFIVLCILASVIMSHQSPLEDSIIKEDILETIPQQQEQNENVLPIPIMKE